MKKLFYSLLNEYSFRRDGSMVSSLSFNDLFVAERLLNGSATTVIATENERQMNVVERILRGAKVRKYFTLKEPTLLLAECDESCEYKLCIERVCLFLKRLFISK